MDWFQIIEKAAGFVYSIFGLAALFLLFTRFLSFKYKTPYTILAMVVSCNIPSYAVTLLHVESVYQWVFTGIYLFVFAIVFCKGTVFMKFVAAIVYSCFSELVAYLSIPTIYLSGYYAPGNSSFGAEIGRALINQSGVVFTGLLFFIIIDFISKNLRVGSGFKTLKYGFVFLLPNVFIVTILCEYFKIYYGSGFGRNSLWGNFKMVGFSALALICGILVLLGLDRLMKENRQKEQEQLLRRQLDMQLQHYEGLKIQLQDTAGFKHDIKNHLICMKNLMDSGNREEISTYLEKLTETVNTLGSEISSGNPIADAVLLEKSRLCEAKNIQFSLDGKIMASKGLEPFDLCVVLGNVLDNAIEACEKIQNGSKFVRMKLGKNRDYLFIDIENSAMENLKAIEYGIGLLNIKKVVEKYQGTMDFEIEKNLVKLGVTLKI